MKAFKINTKYGNDLTLEVIKRTAKTVTIKTSFGEQRIKLRGQENELEYISFKCWLIYATDEYNEKEAQKQALERAYYS
jgi:hypothetical protein